jgi:hypothetical protein
MYDFRSGGDGIAHGATDDGAVTQELAEYALGVCGSQIVLLVSLAELAEPDVPF